MKKVILFLLMVGASTLNAQQAEESKTTIENVLDDWHKAAAASNFETYFGLMTKDAIFIGTDPTENWDVAAFKVFAKPYFDKGKAWNFKPVERHVFLSPKGDVAWFDELLDTWMKLCRGSGVMVKQPDGKWKIAHYILSMTIPNDNTNEVIKVTSILQDAHLKKITVGKK